VASSVHRRRSQHSVVRIGARYGPPQIDAHSLGDTRGDPQHRGEVIEARSKAGILFRRFRMIS